MPPRGPRTVTYANGRSLTYGLCAAGRTVGYTASYATSALNTDRAHRLSILLTGDVPPQHLMRPVYPANGRCAPSAFNVPCPLRW
jgi:hypothetical protein